MTEDKVRRLLNTKPSSETVCALMEIQKLLELTPERKVSVMRTDVNKCQIKEKGTRKVIYEGTATETLRELEKILDTTIVKENKKKIEKIVDTFPPDTIKVYMEEKWCKVEIKYPSHELGYIFGLTELESEVINRNLIVESELANKYYREQNK